VALKRARTRHNYRPRRQYNIEDQWWTCATCGKRAYPTRHAARHALRNAPYDTSRMAAYKATCHAGIFHIGHTNATTRDRYRGQAA
jgi:hypothetical protein